MQYAWYKKQSKTIFNECVVNGLKCFKRYIGKINWVHEFVKGGKEEQNYVIDSLNIVWKLLGRKKQSDLMIFVLKLTSSFWKGFWKEHFFSIKWLWTKIG